MFGITSSRTALVGVALAGGGLGLLGGPVAGPHAAQAQEISDFAEVRLERVSGDDQFWYTGRQLRSPVVVRLPDVDSDRCARYQVEFLPASAGIPSPDTVNGTWEEGSCLFRANWSLAREVGHQHLKAILLGGEEGRTVFTATAREGARVFFGVGYTPRQDAFTELQTNADGSFALRRVEPQAVVRPLLGVDFPLWPTWDRIRVSAAASAKEIDEFFYFGISGLQLAVFGHAQEAAAIDLHFGLQLSRRDIGLQGGACGEQSFCTRRDLRFAGLTMILAIDSASAFKGLAGAVLR